MELTININDKKCFSVDLGIVIKILIFLSIILVEKKGIYMHLASFLLGVLIGYLILSVMAVGKEEELKLAIIQMVHKNDNTLCKRLLDGQ